MQGEPTQTLPIPAAAETTISDLPEELLHNILSVLPPRAIAQLCTTSKRLYSAWNSIPYLDLDQTSAKTPSSLPIFSDYVDTTLRRRPPGTKLKKFRLCSVTESNLCQEAVNYAVANGVEELSLALFCGPHHAFPTSLLRAESLRVLTLAGFQWAGEEDRDLTLSYPALEIANFYLCSGFGNLKMVSCHRLKELRALICPKLKSVWLDSSSCSNLKVVEVHGDVKMRIKFNGGLVPQDMLLRVERSERLSSELWRWTLQ